jgi:hypothetical protein
MKAPIGADRLHPMPSKLAEERGLIGAATDCPSPAQTSTRPLCSARAVSDHATAAPPSAASNSRPPMVTVIRPSRARCVKVTISRHEHAVPNSAAPGVCTPARRLRQFALALRVVRGAAASESVPARCLSLRRHFARPVAVADHDLASRLIAPCEGKCESFRGRLPPFGWFVSVGCIS